MMTICPKVNYLKVSRVKQGLSVRKLALKANINPATISKVENGTTNPTPSTASKICIALNCRFDDAFELIETTRKREA